MANEARVDKYLWSVRLFKTRTTAAEACKQGRIMIAGAQVKPARMVKVGDVVHVRKPPVTYSFEVLKAIEKRVGAPLAVQCYRDVTTHDQLRLLEVARLSGFVDRQRGTGRPTKKERRDLEEFTGVDETDYEFD